MSSQVKTGLIYCYLSFFLGFLSASMRCLFLYKCPFRLFYYSCLRPTSCFKLLSRDVCKLGCREAARLVLLLMRRLGVVSFLGAKHRSNYKGEGTLTLL